MAKKNRKQEAAAATAAAVVSAEEEVTHAEVADQEDPNGLIWIPSQTAAYLCVLGIRLLAARVTCVADCDETYNYWEPLHYILYGFGQQTWEYAPQYALRSYAYLIPSMSAAKIAQVLLGLLGHADDKTQVWLGVKIFWAVCCGLAELSFYQAVTERFGKRIGSMAFMFSVMSAGMFGASAALLPSSTAMILVMYVYTAWLKRLWNRAILLGVICVFGLAWPFCAVLFVPMAIDCLYERYTKEGGMVPALMTIAWGVSCVAVVLFSVTYVDSACYGTMTSPNLNIFRYNVLQSASGKGDQLYGVEHWTYYAKNLILNTTVAIGLALLLPAFAVMVQPMASKVYKTTVRTRMMFASPLYIWLFIMITKPHKEERFLYPVYPLIFLAAAMTLQSFLDVTGGVVTESKDEKKEEGDKTTTTATTTATAVTTTSTGADKSAGVGGGGGGGDGSGGGGGGGGGGNRGPQILCMALVIWAGLFGMLRTSAVSSFYGAPCHVYKAAYYQEFADYWSAPGNGKGGETDHAKGGEIDQPKGGEIDQPKGGDDVRLCVGGEWHRFPSSFFLPSHKIKLSYVRSSFHGQLPQPYVPGGRGMSAEPLQPFNDLNQEEESRYTRLRDCDYVVELTLRDRDNARTSDLMHELARTKGRWEPVVGFPFLDAERSDPVLRAFKVPFLSEKAVQYGRMAMYKRVMADPPGETPSRNV